MEPGQSLLNRVVFVPFFWTPRACSGADILDDYSIPFETIYIYRANSSCSLPSTNFCWPEPEVTWLGGGFGGLLDDSGLFNLSRTGSSQEWPAFAFCRKSFGIEATLILDQALTFPVASYCQAWLCWGSLGDEVIFNTEALTFLMVLDKGQPSLTGSNLLESDFDCFGCSSLDSIADFDVVKGSFTRASWGVLNINE